MDNSVDFVQPKDAKYLKRKVKSGAINVHPTEPTLIVNYTVEAIILGESDNPVISDKKECQKLIKLKSLNKNSDCAALAREVVNKCSLIHPGKVKEVEHLICFLQSRKDNAFTSELNLSNGSNSNSSASALDSSGNSSLASTPEKASFSRLQEYTELLYEEIIDKVRGSAMILQLTKEKDNLDELSRTDALLSALARVLREDYKKSLELSCNLVSIFQCFSQFNQFHPLIQQYKIGSLCMNIVEFELGRYQEWKEELGPREGRKEVVSRLPLPKRSATPSPSPHDRHRLTLSAISNKSSSSTPTTPDDESDKRKVSLRIAKQDRVLKACFSLLMNIAESLKVEDKIRKRNIVGDLIQCLQRTNIPLLVSVVKFLHKLSIRYENKDEMANLNVIEKIPKLLQMNSYDLEKATLLLLFNLSFDSKLRDKMLRVGFLQKFVSLLGDERHLKMVLKLLYHLSVDDKVKAMFPFTDCLSKLMKMVSWFDPESEEFTLVVGVCINVAVNQRCAESMSDNGTLDRLIQRAFALTNPLLLKILRNLSSHRSTRQNFLAFADDFLKILPDCDNEDFLLECVGILSNLPLHEIKIASLMDQYNLISWIKLNLIPGKCEDDLILEVVMVVGAIAADEDAAKMFCKADLLSVLIGLLQSKQEDDELVLQIIYVFYQISRHDSTRNYLTDETEAADYVIDLMSDKNLQIKRVCDACIEYINEDNRDFEEKVKIRKFEHHNYHWLSVVENKSLEVSLSTSSLADSTMPTYNFLNHNLMMGSRMSLGNLDDIEIISNNPNSDDGSRPVSRYDSEVEDMTDSMSSLVGVGRGGNRYRHHDDISRAAALGNLVLAEPDLSSTSPLHFYQIREDNSIINSSNHYD